MAVATRYNDADRLRRSTDLVWVDPLTQTATYTGAAHPNEVAAELSNAAAIESPLP